MSSRCVAAAIVAVVVILLLPLGSVDAMAQEADPEARRALHGAEEHHAGHHPNHIALFVGASTLTGEAPEGGSGTAFTLGLDYERRLTSIVGLGLLVDYVAGEVGRAFLLAVPLFVRPVGGARTDACSRSRV